jgi:iron complex outermembrane receptor protein
MKTVQPSAHAGLARLARSAHSFPARRLLAALLALPAAGSSALFAQTSPAVASGGEEVVQLEAMEVVATDVANLLPNAPIATLFGPAVIPSEVPSSFSSVTANTIDRYGIRSTRDLVSIVPGTFTPSNYGIDGGVRIRGEDGEVYFRGFRKLQNTALFPTPLGATDRIDVVRGPASAVFGPSRNSGYLNFVPKSAASEYLTGDARPFSKVSVTAGSYDYYKTAGEFGTPLGKDGAAGSAFVYVEGVDAKSFYHNDYDQSVLVQSSVDLNLSKRWTAQAGFMYYDWEGKNNIGWNRVTQDLIDNGTYVTGQPVNINGFDGVVGNALTPSDFSIASGNGPQNGAPFQFGSNFRVFYPFGAVPPDDPNSPGNSLWRLQNVGTTRLDRASTLVDSVDYVWVENITAYADAIYQADSGIVFKNQVFFDTYKSENYASYGFSGLFESSVVENRATLEFANDFGAITARSVAGASVRHFDGIGKNAFGQGMQHSDRRDLSIGATPNDRLISAFDGTRSWSFNDDSRSTNYGLFLQSALDLPAGFGVLGGVRYDYFDVETVSRGDFSVGSAKDQQDAFSGSVGLNWKAPGGLVPYVNYTRSAYLLTDSNGGTFDQAIVSTGDYLQDAELYELGVKGSFLDKKLFATVAAYKQQRARTDAVGNPIELESRGIEAELRYAPSRSFSLTAAATWQKTTQQGKDTFVRVPLAEVERLLGTTIDPADYYGGVVESTAEFLGFPKEFEVPGQPDRVFSLYGTYVTPIDLGVTLGATYVPEVNAGYFGHVKLPSYVLTNASLFYKYKNWEFALRIRNLLDEEYFTPQVFWDDLLVLPSEPRTYDLTVSYTF